MNRPSPLLNATCAALFAAAGLLAPALAGAHSDHGKPQHGGIVAEAGEFQAELVAKPDLVNLFLSEHEKKVDSKGATAKLTLLNGTEKSDVALAPAGDNKLEAKGNFKFGPNTKIVATVTVPGKGTKTLRFASK